MQRLRILSPLFLALFVLSPAARAADEEKVEKMNVGDVLSFDEALPQVLPKAGTAKLMPRNGRPLLLLFWGRNSQLGREGLVEMADFVRSEKLFAKMDVFAVGSFREDTQKPADLADAAHIEGVTDLPILADEGFALSRLVGASQFPEIALVDKDGKLLARGIRSLDHGRLGPGQSLLAQDLIRLLAQEGTFEPMKRTWPSYPADRLIGRKYEDFSLPRFHPDGWGKGVTERLSGLLSGQRPAVLFFFSSTCKHCQVDVPQLVKFLKENPDMFDVVGITRIKNERHRSVSEAYFKAQGIEFPILEDVGNVSELYRVNSTPTTFYLSPAGRITKLTYYQHQDLAKDYLNYYGMLMGAPMPAPPARDRGWHFPLKLKDPAGKVVDLSSMEGKPTVLHFWATWCKPCREELPGLLRRLPALERRANVLMVSVDEDPSKIPAYQESSGLKFESYHSPHSGLAETIDFSRSVPRTYVLDGHGRLSKILAGSYEWDDPDRFAGVEGRLSN